jgi:hypothetical protein
MPAECQWIATIGLSVVDLEGKLGAGKPVGQ